MFSNTLQRAMWPGIVMHPSGGGHPSGRWKLVYPMSFLLRLCFWFGLVLLLIPFGSTAMQDKSNTVGAFQAANAAREAVQDTIGICDRKPDVCATAKGAFNTIMVRAKETAKIALDYINSETDKTATGSISNGGRDNTPRPPEPVGKN
jgi:hypothetical protein